MLIKQSNRLHKKDGDSSKLIATSLRDIGSLFQANSQTQEDDEAELLDHKAYLNQLLESGELERLARSRFQSDSSTNKISIQALVSKFPTLSNDELDLIKEAATLNNSRAWTEAPLHMMQLAYYLSFGSYGPRSDIPFKAEGKPLDFTFKERSIKRNDSTVRKLSKDQLVDPLTLSQSRRSHFSAKTLDPMSKIVVWSAICVSLLVGWQEWNLKREDASSTV